MSHDRPQLTSARPAAEDELAAFESIIAASNRAALLAAKDVLVAEVLTEPSPDATTAPDPSPGASVEADSVGDSEVSVGASGASVMEAAAGDPSAAVEMAIDTPAAVAPSS